MEICGNGFLIGMALNFTPKPLLKIQRVQWMVFIGFFAVELFDSNAADLRASNRLFYIPSFRGYFSGFRCAD